MIGNIITLLNKFKKVSFRLLRRNWDDYIPTYQAGTKGVDTYLGKG